MLRSIIGLVRFGETTVNCKCGYMKFKACRLLVFTALMFTCIPSTVFATGGTIEWLYNTAVINKQETKAMAVDSMGNTILVGFTVNATKDYRMIKVSSDGSGLAWPEQTFDLAGAEDVAMAVVVDGNDDIIVTGYADNGTDFDIHTIKYSGLDGSILWQHSFDGTGHGDDFAAAIIVDHNDNIYVGGTMQDASAKDDFVVIKYDPTGPIADGTPNGAPTWSVNYNSQFDGHDRLTAIAVGADGIAAENNDIAVTGESQNAAGDFDFVVVKYNSAHIKSWDKRYNDIGDGKGLDVAMDKSGAVIATGYVDNGTLAVSDLDHYTVKYPSNEGAFKWEKIKDHGADDSGRALWLDSADNVYVTGTLLNPVTSKDLSVTRYAASSGKDTAPDGWHFEYNTENGNSDVGVDIVGDNSGDIFVVSVTNDNGGGFNDIHTYKVCKEHGNMLWTATYGTASNDDNPIGLSLAPDGHPIVAGWSDTPLNDFDYIAVKYNAGMLDPPTSLSATTVSISEIALSWSDNSDNEESFVVERKNGATDWAIVSTLVNNTVSFNDTGLTQDHRYYYRVKAINTDDGNSPWSNEADARTTIVSYEQPTWQHTYAGVDAGDDEPAAIAVGPDNHPVVTGFSFEFEGGYDYYTIKLDRTDASTEQWSARYNDGDNESDYATSVAVDSSNRAVVSGFSSLPGADGNTNDIFTLGYPSGGSTPTWTDQYNGPSGNDDRSTSVATAVDGSDNVVVVGYGKNATLDNDIYVIKYSATGPSESPLWAATPYDRLPRPVGGGDDQPAAVAYDLNGDVFVAGKSWNGNDFDYFVAKYNGDDGSLAWSGLPRFYNGAGNSSDYANSLAVDSVGDLYVTGYSVGSSATGDIVTLKYDGATGNVVSGWPKIYDGGSYDTGVSIVIDPINNDIVVAGTTSVGPGNHDVVVVRYSSDGTEVWTKFLDFTGSDEAAAAMSIDRSGVVCIIGATDSGSGDDIVAVMFDHNGLIVGANVMAGVAGGLDYPVDVVFNAYGEAFVAGVTMNADNNTDYIVFKTTSTVMPAPSPLTATLLYTEANLSWSDNSLDEIGFIVEGKTGACSDTGSWAIETFKGADQTEHLVSGLTPGSPYCFRVQASNALGEKSRWSELNVVTVAAEPPSDLRASALSTTEILLEWNDTTIGETNFNLQRCMGSGCDPSSATPIELPAESISYVDSEVCEGEIYRYRINSEKKEYWASDYSLPTSDAAPLTLPSPSTLKSDWVSEAWAELTWVDNSVEETGFVVERCVGSGCSNFSDYTPVTITSVPDSVLHMRMDEISWNNTADEVIDLSPEGNHGRAYGSATTTTSGRYASAGQFNGTSSYVATSLLIDQSVATSTGATFSAWVNPELTDNVYRYVISTDNNGYDWGLILRNGYWYIANGTTRVYTGIVATMNACQHMTLVFDPVSGVKLYKSDESGTVTWSNASIAFEDSTATVHFGRRGSYNSEFFNGRMDEVAIFNRPLTAVEAGILFEHGLGRYNDRTVVHSTIYNYQVSTSKDAFCDATSLPSNIIQLTTNPPAPSGLIAFSPDSDQVTLKWTDNTTSETSFRIDRCQGSGCSNFTELTTVGPDITFYADTEVCADLNVDLPFNYRVTAIKDADWSSLPSNSSQAVLKKTGTSPTLSVVSRSEDIITLNLNYTSTDLTGFLFSRCDGDATFCADSGNFAAPENLIVTPAGSQLLMHMDEPALDGRTSEVADSSGHGNHGTSYGGMNTGGGKYGRGGSFNGIDDYIRTPLIIDQSATTPGVTFEAWVYPTANNSSYKFVISTENGGYDWSIYQRNSNWYVMNGSNYIDTGVAVSLNAWQHIVAVFQPGVGVRFYKNGSGVLATSAIGYDTNSAGNDYVTIGRMGNTASSANHFVGGIDEVVVYNRVLSTAEVLARYQRPLRYVDSGLPVATPYSYRVKAYKDYPVPGCNWESSFSTVKSTATLAPPPPTDLSFSVVDTTNIKATWLDKATSETDYRIQWCEGTGCTFPASPTVNSTTLGANAQDYLDDAVCEGHDYRYQVRAEKDWVSEAVNTWVTTWTVGTAEVHAKDKSATDSFASEVLSESEISLTWADNNTDEDTYILQRCLNTNVAVDCPVDAVDDQSTFENMDTTIFPTLWFKMDETSWGTPVNSAPGGNNASRRGNAKIVTDSERGNVGYFDGSGDYLQVNHYAGINPSQSITVSVWAKSSGATWDSDYSVMSKRNAFILGPVLGTGNVRFHIFRDGDNWQGKAVNPGVDITQWHQYTAVYDGINLILYVDGIFKGQATYPGTIKADTGYLEIGRDDGNTAAAYNLGGWLDDALIFDEALSSTEVLALYNDEINLSTSNLDTGLTPSTEYFYRLRASKEVEDGCDWPIEWALQSETTMSPPPPTELKVTTINTTQVDINWVDNSGAETAYRVQRCEGLNCFTDDPDDDALLLTDDLAVIEVPDTQFYSDLSAVEGRTYSYRVRAERWITGVKEWGTDWVGPETAKTWDKLAPGNLVATRISEAQIELSWDDSNNDETGYRIERCAGELCNGTDFVEIDVVNGDGAPVTTTLAAGPNINGSFTDLDLWVIHPLTGSTVRALRLPFTGHPAPGSTSLPMTLNTDTNYVVTFEAWSDDGPAINVQNDLHPDTLPEFQHLVSPTPKQFRIAFNSGHADMLSSPILRFFHYNLDRNIFIANIKMVTPSTVIYTDSDSELLPGATYRYRVNTYKTAVEGVNSWPAGPSNIATVATDVVAPSDLSAEAINPTEVVLTWSDNTETETGTEVWRRCDGLLAVCEEPEKSGFVKIDEVGPNIATYRDVDVAKETDYWYKVVARNEGLSSYGGGTWSHYAPVVISPFVANGYYQLTVTHNSQMQDDFGDLRFYDETAQRQLPYWVKESVTGTSATVLIKIRGHNAINMYYGNPEVGYVGSADVFYDKYDFSGTVIDSSEWAEIDAYDAIEQSDGLIIKTSSNSSWNKALISQKTYDRRFQWELYADLTIDADTNGSAANRFALGWLLDQTTFTSPVQFVHSLYWDNTYLRTYEKGSNVYVRRYVNSTDYESRAVLTPTGAEYYLRDGSTPDWTLLKTLDNNVDQVMRVAIGQSSHNATIKSMTVTPTPLPATLGGEVVNVRTDFGFPWPGVESNIATLTTPAPVAPSGLIVMADSDKGVSLKWTDGTADETGFKVERCEGSGCSGFTQIGITSANEDSYYDTFEIEPETYYRYRVRAYKTTTYSWDSAYCVPEQDLTFSARATLLTAVPVSSRMIELVWKENASDEEGYEIEVQIWNGQFVSTGQVIRAEELIKENPTYIDGVEARFVDTVGINVGETYVYRVRPFRGDDKSPYSNNADATPLLSHGDGTCYPLP